MRHPVLQFHGHGRRCDSTLGVLRLARGGAFQSNTIPPQPVRVAPAVDAAAASGASDPEAQHPPAKTVSAGISAAQVQLCLQCRVPPPTAFEEESTLSVGPLESFPFCDTGSSEDHCGGGGGDATGEESLIGRGGGGNVSFQDFDWSMMNGFDPDETEGRDLVAAFMQSPPNMSTATAFGGTPDPRLLSGAAGFGGPDSVEASDGVEEEDEAFVPPTPLPGQLAPAPAPSPPLDPINLPSIPISRPSHPHPMDASAPSTPVTTPVLPARSGRATRSGRIYSALRSSFSPTNVYSR